MDKRPNIILLMADQMRGDCLGIAGIYYCELCRV